MRYFEKREGAQVSSWQIQQEGVRYFVAWSVDGGKSSGKTFTRESEAIAAQMVERKIREKVKLGFVEVQPIVAPSLPPKELANVLSVYAQHASKFKFAVRKIEGLTHAYHVFGGTAFSHEEFLVVGAVDTVGLWFAVKKISYDPRAVNVFLTELETRFENVFATKVVWKFRLNEPLGGMTHAVVLAPVVARLGTKGLAPKQQFQAFPIYDCEFRGDETIAEAEARSMGRGSIATSTWNREPHPVLGMRLQSSATKSKAKFLIYDPGQLQPVVRRLESLPAGSTLDVKNYRGEIGRVTRTAELEVRWAENTNAETLSPTDIVLRMGRFIRE